MPASHFTKPVGLWNLRQFFGTSHTLQLCSILSCPLLSDVLWNALYKRSLPWSWFWGASIIIGNWAMPGCTPLRVEIKHHSRTICWFKNPWNKAVVWFRAVGGGNQLDSYCASEFFDPWRLHFVKSESHLRQSWPIGLFHWFVEKLLVFFSKRNNKNQSYAVHTW